MRSLSGMIVAGILAFVLLGLLFKLVLDRYAPVLVLAFFGLTFIVPFAAFLLFILTDPANTDRQD